MAPTSRPTFHSGDPVGPQPSTPASASSGNVRISRRRLGNQSSEDSNASSSSGSAPLSSPLSTSTGSSPSTALTEPDPIVQVPTMLESPETLRYLGLNEKRAEAVWQKWKTINQNNFNGDFGDFTRRHLRSLVEYEDCDTGEEGTDWRPALRRIGADDHLADAIGGQDAKYDGVRLRHTAAEWVDQAIDWRWEWLRYITKASKVRSKGGLSLPQGSAGNTTVLVNAGTISQIDDNEDVTRCTYDRATTHFRNGNGEETDFLPFYKGTTRTRAEKMWAGPRRTGAFDIKVLLSKPGTDFAGRHVAHNFTPEVEGAQTYASYANNIADPAGVCIVRIEVPKALLNGQTVLRLKDPEEDWKRLVWCSRREEKVDPKDLQRKVASATLLVGDTTTGVNAKYGRMKDWSQVDAGCLQKLNNGTPLTQFVFAHHDNGDLDDKISAQLGDKTTLRSHQDPNIKLPPIDSQAPPAASK